MSYYYAFLLALTSLFGIGSSDFLYKRARSEKATPETFLLLQAVFFNLTDFFVLLLTGQQVRHIFILLISGLSEAALLYSAFLIFIASLKGIDVSSGAPLFRLNFLVTSLLAYVILGEKFGNAQLIGSTLSILAIVLFSWNARSSFRRIRTVSTTLFAMVLYGVSGFVYKFALDNGVNPVQLISMQGLFFLTIAFLSSVSQNKLTFKRAEIVNAPLCGILLSLSLIMLNEALELQPANLIYPISQLSFTFTAVLAFAFFRERLDLLKLAGLISATAAIIALSL